MRCLTKTIVHDSRSDMFRIIPISDTHLGHIAADERLIQRTIDDIRDSDNTFWFGLGDILDGIGRMDKRHREESLAPWCHGVNRVFKEQRDRAVEMFRPIGKKCIGYGMGNHEEHLESSGVDLYYSVLEGILDNDNEDLALGISGFIVLKFQRCGGDYKGSTQTYVIYVHHGAGGGQQMGSKAIKLERLPAAYEADLYIIGHTHTKLAFPMQRLAARRGKLQEREMWLCNTGGFLRSAIEETAIYSEVKMYKPLSLGSIEIQLYPGAERPADKVRVIL